MEFKINETLVPQVEKYDNAGAHNAIKSMMQKKETLSIKLYTDKENYPCIWIESYNVAGFKYYVNPASFKWIYTYLTTGESEDAISCQNCFPPPQSPEKKLSISTGACSSTCTSTRPALPFQPQ